MAARMPTTKMPPGAALPGAFASLGETGLTDLRCSGRSVVLQGFDHEQQRQQHHGTRMDVDLRPRASRAGGLVRAWHRMERSDVHGSVECVLREVGSRSDSGVSRDGAEPTPPRCCRASTLERPSDRAPRWPDARRRPRHRGSSAPIRPLVVAAASSMTRDATVSLAPQTGPGIEGAADEPGRRCRWCARQGWQGRDRSSASCRRWSRCTARPSSFSAPDR